MLRLGALSILASLESPSEGAPGELGGRPAGWVAQGQAWVQVEPLSGRELEVARQVDARTSHLVRMRYRAGVSATWRVRLPRRREADDLVLQIVSARNVDEADDELELLCVEVAR